MDFPSERLIPFSYGEWNLPTYTEDKVSEPANRCVLFRIIPQAEVAQYTQPPYLRDIYFKENSIEPTEEGWQNLLHVVVCSNLGLVSYFETYICRGHEDENEEAINASLDDQRAECVACLLAGTCGGVFGRINGGGSGNVDGLVWIGSGVDDTSTPSDHQRRVRIAEQ